MLGIERSTTGIPVALLARAGETPIYVGNAMISFGDKDRDRIWRAVEKYGTPHARVAELHKHKAQWLKPGIRASVRHLRGESKLRRATLQSVTVGTTE